MPTGEDVGKWLRATASYVDGEGDGKTKTAQVVSDNPVNAKPYSNTAPVYDQDLNTDGVQVSFDENPNMIGVQTEDSGELGGWYGDRGSGGGEGPGAGRSAGDADLLHSGN